jgi:hypothetical protein
MKRDLVVQSKETNFGRPMRYCRFCGVSIKSGSFCRQCITLKLTAEQVVAQAVNSYVDPQFGPLVVRHGPHSVLIRQPTAESGMPMSLENA